MRMRPMDGLALVPSGAALPILAVAVVILLLGCVCLARERSSSITISFFILAAAVSWWLASASLMMMSVTREGALLWARVVYVGVSVLPATVLQFSLALTQELRKRRILLGSVWAVSALFVALFTLTPWLIADTFRYRWGAYAKLEPASITFVLFLAAALAESALTLRRAIAGDSTEQQKRRAASFLTALIVGYAGAIDFLPSFGVDFAPIGYLAVLGFVVLSIRTIHRYRFVDLAPSLVASHLLDTVQGGVIAVDMRGTIRLANPAASLLFAQSGSLIGEDLHSLLQLRALPLTDSDTFNRIGRTRNQALALTRRDGLKVEVSVSATLLRDQEQIPVGILYVMHDLSERRRAERHEFAANHDPLTGIPNRAYLTDRFEPIVSEIEGHGRSASVLFLDLDGFKRVNDEHGHTVGDRLLQLVAARLRNALRDDDLLARYGGDEFIALLSIRRAADAQVVADKLLRVLRDPFAVESLTLRIGASIGIAIAPRDGSSMDDLVRVADEAMYRAKRGQNSSSRGATDRVVQSPFGAESRA